MSKVEVWVVDVVVVRVTSDVDKLVTVTMVVVGITVTAR